MIIILSTIVVLIASAILFIVYYKTNEKHVLLRFISIFLFILFWLAMICECIVLAYNHGTAKNEYNKAIYKKEVLQYRLKNDGLAWNEFLYHDITDFNNTIREARYWYENPWTSWFNSGLIPSIDYIEIDMNNNA